MSENRTVLSSHFKVTHIIAGQNVHLLASHKFKDMWYMYLEACINPEGTFQYVGSTDSMTHWWANTKSKCITISRDNNTKPGTGLKRHLKSGCSQYEPEMNQVRISLLEYCITSEEKLNAVRNGGGAGCHRSQCFNLKKLEDKWISRFGTYHAKILLN